MTMGVKRIQCPAMNETYVIVKQMAMWSSYCQLFAQRQCILRAHAKFRNANDHWDSQYVVISCYGRCNRVSGYYPDIHADWLVKI